MDIEKELTPEIVMGIGKMWGESYLKSLPVQERLAGLKPEEILDKLSTEDIKNYLKNAKRKGSA